MCPAMIFQAENTTDLLCVNMALLPRKDRPGLDRNGNAIVRQRQVWSSVTKSEVELSYPSPNSCCQCARPPMQNAYSAILRCQRSIDPRVRQQRKGA